MSNSSRIAKNTLMLYFRRIFILLVSLYIVRIKLEILGIEDYGIYNIVAGVVIMFSFLKEAMTISTQRFMIFYLGQNDTEQVKNVYSASIIIHVLTAFFFILIAETIGLWFFKTWLNIPPERQGIALFVYHFSVALTAINIFQVPYQATIMTYEKMSAFAFISIIDILLKLGAVLLLTIIPFDKLLFYSFFVFLIGLIVMFIQKIYCNIVFKTVSFQFCKDKKLYHQLIKFSGWNLFGQVANVSSSRGTNVLINIFYGVILNSAMGIAMQVKSAVYSFVDNFQTAFRPQIIKSYAAKDYNYFFRFVFQTSKISFFLLFFFTLPLYINADFILQLWLIDVPDYAVIFTQLILLNSLVVSIAGPLTISIQATGNIKIFQLIESCLRFINLPLSFLFLYLGFSPVFVLFTRIAVDILSLIWRIVFLKKEIKLPILGFLSKVFLPILIITVTSTFITVFFQSFFIGWIKLFLSCIISSSSIILLIFIFGLDKQEKKSIKNWINKSFLYLKLKKQQ